MWYPHLQYWPLHCYFLQQLLLFCSHAFYTWCLPHLQPPSYSPIAYGLFLIVASGHQVQPIVLEKETEKDNRLTTAEVLGNIRSLVSDLFGCHVCRWCVVTVHDISSFLSSSKHVRYSVHGILPSYFPIWRTTSILFRQSISTLIWYPSSFPSYSLKSYLLLFSEPFMISSDSAILTS